MGDSKEGGEQGAGESINGDCSREDETDGGDDGAGDRDSDDDEEVEGEDWKR